GFDGKSVINPRQIPLVIEIFTPSAKDIEKSVRIIEALHDAEAKGLGVVSLNGKMIDKPVVIRAERMLDLAVAAGVYKREAVK
ncbi:MAG: citrate lyase subunit beta, partial [Angelakisella sp.]